ncbi:MAG: hypothetical protein MUF14_09000 [Hyphomonadaceae bacterium]|nr:hypothetical protein [Hyphomonadaceae bacterium]
MTDLSGRVGMMTALGDLDSAALPTVMRKALAVGLGLEPVASDGAA